MEIKPLNGFVQVEILEEKEEGLAILPETHRKSKFGMGEVITIESDLPIKKGDIVLFDILLITEVPVEGKKLQFIKFDDIIGYERRTEKGAGRVDKKEVRKTETLPPSGPESAEEDLS